jgi:hypothetical protein
VAPFSRAWRLCRRPRRWLAGCLRPQERVKKEEQNFFPVLPEPHVMHNNTAITPRSVSGSSKSCIQTQRITSHTASQQQAPYCPHWRYECRQHVNRRYNNVTYVHRLFVRATAASVGVFAPQAKKSGQIRPIQRKCVRALSGSFRSMNAEVTRAHHAPHSLPNSQQHPTAAASRYGALLGADPRPRPRLICGN